MASDSRRAHSVPCTECARQQSDRCASSGRASQQPACSALCTITQSSSLLTSWKSSARRVAHRTGAHIHRAWCPADGPSPQKGRRCSPSSVWAASRATLAFPICGFDLLLIVNVPMTHTTSRYCTVYPNQPAYIACAQFCSPCQYPCHLAKPQVHFHHSTPYADSLCDVCRRVVFALLCTQI